MPIFESYEPGWPCWIDCASPDVDAAKEFYGAVFGWTGTDVFDDDGNRVYTNFQLDGRNVCGLSAQQPEMAGMPALWSTYICTNDIDQTTQRVEAAGGTVMLPPMQVMDAGSMAVFADPTGAVICAWQPGQHIGAEVANDPDTWSWNELLDRDLPTAQAFYADVFDWTFDSQEMPNGTYHVIEGGQNGGLGGMMDMPAEIPAMVPNHWMVYFATDDLDATVERITGAGGQIVNPPFAIPGVGRMCTAHDPQGGNFSLLQPEMPA